MRNLGLPAGTDRRVHALIARGAVAEPEVEDEVDDFSDLVGPDDHDTIALIHAMAEVEARHSVQRWDESKHVRNPKGPGGGRFRSMVNRLVDAIEKHNEGTGEGHPFDGFSREQLRRVARARGIELKRGESRESIADKLLHGEGSPFHGKTKDRTPAPPVDPYEESVRLAARKHASDVVNFAAPNYAPSHVDAQRKRVVDELTKQADLTPHSMLHLDGVHAHQATAPKGKQFYKDVGHSAGGYYTYWNNMYMNNEIRLSPTLFHDPKGFDRSFTLPGWFARTDRPGLSYVTAHEYGHHLDKRITGGTGTLSASQAKQLLPAIAELIGADASTIPVGRGRVGMIDWPQLDAWVDSHKEKIESAVSMYGASNFRELLAELWTEYSTSSNPRPGFVKIGAILQALAEGNS